MARHIVMDHTGDSRHEFNPADVADVAEAEKRFSELTGAGFTAARRTASGQSTKILDFNPTDEEVLFIPRLVGG